MVDFVIPNAMEGIQETAQPRDIGLAPSTVGEAFTSGLWHDIGSISRGMSRGFAETGVDPVTGQQVVAPETPSAPDALNAKYPGMKFDQPLPDSVAQGMYEANQNETARRSILERRPPGFGNWLLTQGAGVVASMLDPVDDAVSLVPVVGEARYAQWLARAGEAAGTVGRAGVVAGVGAAGGAAGMAPLAALQYGMAQQDHTDMSLADVGNEILQGGGLGAILHLGVGALRGDITGRHAPATPEPVPGAEDVGSAPAFDLANHPDAAPLLAADAATRDAGTRVAAAQMAADSPIDVRPVFDAAESTYSIQDLTAAPGAQGEAPHLGGSSYEVIPPADLTVDPRRFQYKASNEQGVTGALAGTSRWEPELANPVTAWRGNDGKLYVVNGHQRVDLARRAEAAGQEGIGIPARVFNEADGYSPEYMRVLGAYQNIAEGSGTAIDAAKILRGRDAFPEDRRLPGLPPKSQLVQQAQGLAALDEHAFGMVANGVVPAAYAAEVGRAIKDPAQQLGALDALIHAHPANVEQAYHVVQDVIHGGFFEGAQQSLFGETAFAQSLIGERARVLDNAMRNLRQLKGAFGTAVRQEGALSEAGNVMSREANLAGKTANERLAEILRTTATRRGPISDALTDAARSVKAGEPVARVTARFLARARELGPGAIDESLRPGAPPGGAESAAPGFNFDASPSARLDNAVARAAGEPSAAAAALDREAAEARKAPPPESTLGTDLARAETELAAMRAGRPLTEDEAAEMRTLDEGDRIGAGYARAAAQAALCIAKGGE